MTLFLSPPPSILRPPEVPSGDKEKQSAHPDFDHEAFQRLRSASLLKSAGRRKRWRRWWRRSSGSGIDGGNRSRGLSLLPAAKLSGRELSLTVLMVAVASFHVLLTAPGNAEYFLWTAFPDM